MMRSIRRFGGDQRGLAAIEFALILPVLFLLYFGSVEIISAYNAQRRVSHIAAVIADITAQGRTISTADLTDLFKVGEVMMDPFPASGLKQRIASLQANGAGQVSTVWSANSNYPNGPALTVPAGYLAANESVIVAEVIYDYTSPLRLVIPGVVQFDRRSYFRPRVSAQVDKLP
jgi:Flp pilus assembly protein TadG